jgi:GNAT superfamily N-acetyltransferase
MTPEPSMPIEVGPLAPTDAPAVARLLAAYLSETFGATDSPLDAVTLLREGRGASFRTMVARKGDEAVGFAAWRLDYDLHHALRGGEVPDLYVVRTVRGRAVAAQLIAAIARQVREDGGVFLRAAATMENARRLTRSDRLDGAFPLTHVYWAGRRFAALAEHAGARPRALAVALAKASDVSG